MLIIYLFIKPNKILLQFEIPGAVLVQCTFKLNVLVSVPVPNIMWVSVSGPLLFGSVPELFIFGSAPQFSLQIKYNATHLPLCGPVPKSQDELDEMSESGIFPDSIPKGLSHASEIITKINIEYKHFYLKLIAHLLHIMLVNLFLIKKYSVQITIKRINNNVC